MSTVSLMELDNAAPVDEGLYSRQIYTIGLDAMKKMAVSNVLVVGLKGLGTEIAKNIVLAGVKSVTIYDPEPAVYSDLSSQFFISESNLGEPRDRITLPHLAELNPYVAVSVFQGPCHLESLFSDSRFQVVVCSSMTVDEMCLWNDAARAHGVHFIAADTRGLAGFGFCDFGPSFTVVDVTGEPPQTGMIAAITYDCDGIVTCLDESRHGLQDGDYVRFSEVIGLGGINDAPAFQVRVLGPYTFSIGSTLSFSVPYVRGGIYTQVFAPKTLEFRTMAESKASPECLVTDFSKFETPIQLHCAFQALGKFQASRGRPPTPQDDRDAREMLRIAKNFASTVLESPVEIDENFITKFSKQAAGDLSPMAAVIGGLMAHEVLKACSHKLHPIKQYFYFDSFESLPPARADNTTSHSRTEFVPMNSRYDGQIVVFGRTMQEKIAGSRCFLVGAGAIGCEMLKNWAMMGVATGSSGQVCVTDMDSIEKSNLNRQFLFRNHDVGKPKSETAALAVKKMNPCMEVLHFNERVGPDTEAVFDDTFWNAQDIITNALDNVDARKYVDRRCVIYCKPLLESGTLGVKGSTQVVIPHVTESYSSSNDPPEKSIPICTLKNFPNQIEHTIQWARDVFEGLFVQPIEDAAKYLQDPKACVENIHKYSTNVADTLKSIKLNLVDLRPQTFECCVAWARLKYEELLVNNIKQLLFNFPADVVNQSGIPFWSGPKRAPDVCNFNAEDELHMDFIYYAAKLRALNFGINMENVPCRKDTEYFRSVLDKISVPPFVPAQNVRIHVVDSEAQADEQQQKAAGLHSSPDVDRKIETFLNELSRVSGAISADHLVPAVFEKDDDSNHHIDMITACSNLRAITYKITPADRQHTKFIAGKIIPAIATTTALVTGLVCLELYKLIAPYTTEEGGVTKEMVTKIERYRNSFLTLSGPEFAFSEPIAAPKLKYNEHTFTLWDRFEVNDMPLKELLDQFSDRHQLEVTMLSCGVTMLYSFFMQAKKVKDRLPMMLSDILVQIRNEPLPKEANFIVLEACCNGVDGDDADVPYIVVWLSKDR